MITFFKDFILALFIEPLFSLNGCGSGDEEGTSPSATASGGSGTSSGGAEGSDTAMPSGADAGDIDASVGVHTEKVDNTIYTLEILAQRISSNHSSNMIDVLGDYAGINSISILYIEVQNIVEELTYLTRFDEYENLPNLVIWSPEQARLTHLSKGGLLGNEFDILEIENIGNISNMKNKSSAYLVDLFKSQEGKVLGLPFFISPSSGILYNKGVFENSTYNPPTKWQEMINLCVDMVHNSQTPFGIQDQNGSVGIDWISNILIRIIGLEEYTKWSTHVSEFNSDQVKEAFKLFFNFINTGKYVYKYDYMKKNNSSDALSDNSLVRDLAQNKYNMHSVNYMNFRDESYSKVFSGSLRPRNDNPLIKDVLNVFKFPKMNETTNENVCIGNVYYLTAFSKVIINDVIVATRAAATEAKKAADAVRRVNSATSQVVGSQSARLAAATAADAATEAANAATQAADAATDPAGAGAAAAAAATAATAAATASAAATTTANVAAEAADAAPDDAAADDTATAADAAADDAANAATASANAANDAANAAKGVKDKAEEFIQSVYNSQFNYDGLITPLRNTQTNSHGTEIYNNYQNMVNIALQDNAFRLSANYSMDSDVLTEFRNIILNLLENSNINMSTLKLGISNKVDTIHNNVLLPKWNADDTGAFEVGVNTFYPAEQKINPKNMLVKSKNVLNITDRNYNSYVNLIKQKKNNQIINIYKSNGQWINLDYFGISNKQLVNLDTFNGKLSYPPRYFNDFIKELSYRLSNNGNQLNYSYLNNTNSVISLNKFTDIYLDVVKLLINNEVEKYNIALINPYYFIDCKAIENNSIEIKETGIILTLKILENIDNVLNEIINIFMNFFPDHNEEREQELDEKEKELKKKEAELKKKEEQLNQQEQNNNSAYGYLKKFTNPKNIIVNSLNSLNQIVNNLKIAKRSIERQITDLKILSGTPLKYEKIPTGTIPIQDRSIESVINKSIIGENEYVRFSNYQSKLHDKNGEMRNAIANINNKYKLQGRMLYWSFYREFEDILFNKETQQYESIPIVVNKKIDTNKYEITGFKQSVYAINKNTPVTNENLIQRNTLESGLLEKVYVISPKKVADLEFNILQINDIVGTLMSDGLIENIISALKIVSVLSNNLFGIQSNQILDNLKRMNKLTTNLNNGLKYLNDFDVLLKNINENKINANVMQM